MRPASSLGRGATLARREEDVREHGLLRADECQRLEASAAQQAERKRRHEPAVAAGDLDGELAPSP